MSRQTKAMLLIAAIDNPEMQREIYNEMLRNDPIIDLRFSIYANDQETIG